MYRSTYSTKIPFYVILHLTYEFFWHDFLYNGLLPRGCSASTSEVLPYAKSVLEGRFNFKVGACTD